MFGKNKNSAAARHRRNTFVLEPILTPTTILPFDGGEDGGSEVDVPLLPDSSNPFSEAVTPTQLNYESGVFVVGESGEVGIDFLFDGGFYDRGEVGIFSLEGLDPESLSPEEFAQAAAQRALSGTEGHVVISDSTDGARFSGTGWREPDFNAGNYQGVQTFQMEAGTEFGIMLVPNQSIQEVADGTAWHKPLFSMHTENPNDALHFGQIADVTGDGNTFVMEDVTLERSDQDYNDIVFQIRGATTVTDIPEVDELVAEDRDWREFEMGQALIDYAKAYTTDAEELDFFDDLSGESELGEADEVLTSNWLDGDIPNHENWGQSLLETVDQIRASEDATPVLNLSIDIADLTPDDKAAIAYAQQQGIILVVPAGDTPGTISALGELSTEFDNVITVGAAEQTTEGVSAWKGYEAAEFSGSGKALDIVVEGSHGETASTSVAAAKLTQAIDAVWEANPKLNYTQVLDIVQRTATDLGEHNWEPDTGYGLLNLAAAVQLAKATAPEAYNRKPGNLDLTDDFVSVKAEGKELPGIPTHPSGAPGIPATDVDQGGNALGDATELRLSATQDVIDQVGASDPVDWFQAPTRHVDGAGFTVMAGEVKVSYLAPDGTVLGSQTLARGEHQLDLPAHGAADTLIKIEAQGSSPATYKLEGFESTEPEPFDIALEFGDTLTASQQQVMQAAAATVSKLIAQGLPSAIVDGEVIDDIKIKISTDDLDGAGGTQARTKIDFMRYGTLLPAQSLVQFDAADIAELEQSGQLFSAVQHEFMHALGFGNLWEAKGLVDYAGTSLAQYSGKNAVEAFKELGGSSDAISLATEGEGSAGLHWHEQVFQDELMSPDINLDSDADGNALISTVTLASLADLGYDINLDMADADFELLGGQMLKAEDFTAEQMEELTAWAAAAPVVKETDADFIYAEMPEVDPTTVAPEIWAHAEKFWKNGEYYDWERYQIRSGDTLSGLAKRYLGNWGYDYYMWIANRNRIPDPDYIVTGDWIDIPRHRPNYEWEQEQERIRRDEAEQLRQDEERRRQEAEARQRELEEQERRLREEQERRRQEEERRQEEARLREIERQRGVGGEDWYMATKLPDWSNQDPFETTLTGETVGNYVPDDYYRFTLSRKGRLTAELKQLLADADLVLYDARNKPIAYSMREGITDEQIITDLIPGTYMLRVNSPEGKTTDYDLMVRFQHKLSRTQQGPPPGWRVGGNRGGASGPVFADPRINGIYTKALNDFAGPERTKANQRIQQLQAEKRGYEQDLQELLNQMNAEQRAKVHGALDGARHNANVWVDGKADGVKRGIDGTADWILGRIDGAVPNWVYDYTWKIGDSLRDAKDWLKNKVNEARDWLKGKVSWAQDQVKNAIWHFIETVKNSYRTGAEINGIIENAANEMRRKIDNAVNGINGWVEQFKGKITGSLGWTRDVGILGWNFYDSVVQPLANDAANGIKAKVNDVGNFARGAVDWVKPRAQKAVAAIVDAIFGDKTGKLYNKIHGVDDQIAATQSDLERKIVQKASELKNQMQDLLGTLGTEGKKLLDAILNFGNSPTGQFSIIALEILLGMTPIGPAIDIKDTIFALLKIADGDTGVGASVELLGSLAGWVPLAGDAIKSIAKVAMGGALGTILAKFGPDLVSKAKKTLRSTNWGQLVQQAITTIGKKWNEISTTIKKAPGWIRNSLSNKLDEILDTGRKGVDKVQSVSSWIGTKLDEAVNWLVKKIDDSSDISKVLKQLKENAKNALPHVKRRDYSVPRKRGIGGAHDVTEFLKYSGDYRIVNRTSSPNIPGVEKIDYQMRKLDPSGQPTDEFRSKALPKTVYNPQIWTDDKLADAAAEAALDAKNKGGFGREWEGFTKEGYPMYGYQENGKITSFFFNF